MSLKCRVASSDVVTYGWRVRRDRIGLPLACVLFCLPGVVCAEVIRLGGPRDIVVDVEDVRGGFSVTVEMRPVSCFDVATNARINRSKACLYGLTGLGKSLEIDPDRLAAGCDISGVEVDTAPQDENRYRVQFFVPESGIAAPDQPIAVQADPSHADAPTSTPRHRSQLFTCVDDYATTITELKATYDDRLTEVETKAVADGLADAQMEAARQALAQLVIEANLAFTAAGEEFAADLRVLTVEKESLEEVLAAARANFDARSAKVCALVEAAALRATEKLSPASSPASANEPGRSP